MRETQGDLWTWDDGNVVARVITTNGFVKNDGSAVLGAGVAKQAVERFGHQLEQMVGTYIVKYGNHVHAFRPKPELGRPYWLITFPVKPDRAPDGRPGFLADADERLIVRSAKELLAFYLGMIEEGTVVMPRPGCGNGHLEWDDIRGALAHELDQPVRVNFEPTAVSFGDRFVVVER